MEGYESVRGRRWHDCNRVMMAQCWQRMWPCGQHWLAIGRLLVECGAESVLGQ